MFWLQVDSVFESLGDDNHLNSFGPQKPLRESKNNLFSDLKNWTRRSKIGAKKFSVCRF